MKKKSAAHDRVTIQMVHKAPFAVQSELKKLVKSLSKVTRLEWFNIACRSARIGFMESMVAFPSLFEPARAASGGRRGRPKLTSDDEKRGFIDLVERHRVDEATGKVRYDMEVIRHLLATTEQGVRLARKKGWTELDQEKAARKAARRLARYRRALAR